MLAELDEFLSHERQHRELFASQLQRRNRRRCRSYLWCGFGGFILGALTGLAGRQAMLATTVAIERVVLRHMHEQVAILRNVDVDAVTTLSRIISEEQEHHDQSAARLAPKSVWPKVIDPLVACSTEAVIWLGMRL